MSGSLVILTGASGSGKTTIARAIEAECPQITVLRFDTIDVPSDEIMATFGAGHQPGGAWQRAMTLQWFDRIAPRLLAGERVLFEGQMRIAFIREALAAQEIQKARIILVECDDAERTRRLTHDRRQPELADDRMRAWGRYLHDEAREAGCEILETGLTPFAESVRQVLAAFRS